jgi:hypothetical protein
VPGQEFIPGIIGRSASTGIRQAEQPNVGAWPGIAADYCARGHAASLVWRGKQEDGVASQS